MSLLFFFFSLPSRGAESQQPYEPWMNAPNYGYGQALTGMVRAKDGHDDRRELIPAEMYKCSE